MENINNTEYFDAVEMLNSQLMDLYIKQKDYDNAKKIAENYPNSEMIQSKFINLCIDTKRYEEGIEVAQKYSDSKIIQNQLITLYFKSEKYDDVIELYHIQLMSVYCIKEDYDEALNIAQKYPNNDLIQSQLITLCTRTGRYEKGEGQESARKRQRTGKHEAGER